MSSDRKLESKQVTASAELDTDTDQQLSTADEAETKLDEVAGKLAESLVNNPELLERVMSKPGVMGVFQHQASFFEGPMPPPNILDAYNHIVPGAAERILDMTEREQKGRLDAQDKALSGSISKDRRGQWMGYSITLFVLLIAAFFAWRGNTVFAGTLIGIDLLGLAAVFVIGRLDSKDD